MSKETVKNNSRKKNKKVKGMVRWQKRALSTAIIVLFVVCIVTFFAQSLGISPRILNAATVEGESIKVTAYNYAFNQELSNYANSLYSYGMSFSEDDLNTVADEETGETYRDLIRDAALENWQKIILLERQAKQEGFTSSYAKRAADDFVDQLRASVKDYNMTADQYLARMYGRGMTVRKAREIIEREAYIQDYENSLIQDKFAISVEDSQALFEENPDEYTSVSFHFFQIPAIESDEDAEPNEETETPEPTQEDLDAASERAQKIVDTATDPESFKEACKEAGVKAYADAFEDDAYDPTLRSNYDKNTVSTYLGEDVAEYLFDDSREEGDKTVIESEDGAYAIYYLESEINEEPAVSYRKITLAVDSFDTTMTTESQLVEIHQKLEDLQTQAVDEVTFTALARENSLDSSSVAGGLVSNQTRDSFQLTEEAEEEEPSEESEDGTNEETQVEEEPSEENEDGTNEETQAEEEPSEENEDGTNGETQAEEEPSEESEDGTNEETQAEEETSSEEPTAPAEKTADDILYEWLFDSARKAGDMTIVEDGSSVSLYYFRDNLPSYQASIMVSSAQEAYQTWYDGIKEAGEGYSINPRLIAFANKYL